MMDAETKKKLDTLALVWHHQRRFAATLDAEKALEQFALNLKLPATDAVCVELAGAFAVLLAVCEASSKAFNMMREYRKLATYTRAHGDAASADLAANYARVVGERMRNFADALKNGPEQGTFILDAQDYETLRKCVRVPMHVCFCTKACCREHNWQRSVFLFRPLLLAHWQACGHQVDSDDEVVEVLPPARQSPPAAPRNADLDAADEVAEAIAAMPIEGPST